MKAVRAAAALVLAVALSAGGAGYVQAHSFKLGFVAPLSGPQAAVGEALRDGLMVATRERDSHPDEVSDGHLGGLDVYVLPVDGALDGARDGAAVLAEANALMAGEGVEILAAALPGALTVAMREAAQARRTVFIDMNGALPPVTADGGPGEAAFAATFEADTGRAPPPAAYRGYRTARLVDRAIRALGGDLSDRAALRAAIEAALARR
ncbi:MAG: hypothetical protein OEM59_15865 [Rhodospirillales bacterium]|nr:hypothetical protein [Rhodospirillales bacterium]